MGAFCFQQQGQCKMDSRILLSTSWARHSIAVVQVLIAAEEALRRLEVDNTERNAILDAFRYFEQRRADGESSQVSPAAAEEQATSCSEPIDSRPLTR